MLTRLHYNKVLSPILSFEVRKLDHDHRRQEVAEAAAKLIAERGLECLTTRNLAKELRCSIGVLSHYFENKQQIVLAAFHWADQRIDARVQEAMLRQDLCLDTFIPVIIEGLPITLESDMEWKVRFNLYTHAFTEPDLLLAQREKLDHFRRLMEQQIANLQQRGQIRTDTSAELVTQLAFDITIGAAHTLLMLPMNERRERAGRLLTLLDQLRH